MASLHAPVAIAAVSHSNIETAHEGPPDDLFLILGFAAFRVHAAATMWAALRQGDRDSFIHARWGGTARLPAVAPAGFAAGAPRIRFWLAPRMRGSLTLTGTQRRFQFPAQPLRFLFQALVLSL